MIFFSEAEIVCSACCLLLLLSPASSAVLLLLLMRLLLLLLRDRRLVHVLCFCFFKWRLNRIGVVQLIGDDWRQIQKVINLSTTSWPVLGRSDYCVKTVWAFKAAGVQKKRFFAMLIVCFFIFVFYFAAPGSLGTPLAPEAMPTEATKSESHRITEASSRSPGTSNRFPFSKIF